MKPRITLLNGVMPKEYSELQKHENGSIMEITSNIVKVASAILKEYGLNKESDAIKSRFVIESTKTNWDVKTCINMLESYLQVNKEF